MFTILTLLESILILSSSLLTKGNLVIALVGRLRLDGTMAPLVDDDEDRTEETVGTMHLYAAGYWYVH